MREIMGIPEARVYIRPVMGSGSRAQIILFDDGRYYVVKFKGNIQGCRVLPNELIAARLADLLQVPVCEGAVVRVSQEFIDFEPELYRHPFIGGLQFGSLFYEGAFSNPPARLLREIGDSQLFASIIVFDHLIANWDRSNHGDNVLFLAETSPRLVLIDHGHAFHSPEWTVATLEQSALPVEPYFGHFYRSLSELMEGEPFEEPLSRVEALNEESLRSIMLDVPLEWGIYEEEREAMVEYLMRRKMHVRAAIEKLKAQGRFPRCR